MTGICHLLDGSAGWEQRIGLLPLVERLSEDEFDQRAALLGLSPIEPPSSQAFGNEAAARGLRLARLNPLTLMRFLSKSKIDVLHAWGVRAAIASRAAVRAPLVVHLFDPTHARRSARLIRAIARPRHFAVVCSCETVRRRLVEFGVEASLTVVIRPGVDFGCINQWRRENLRAELGIEVGETVTILPEPVTRSGGHFEAYWAISQRCMIQRDVRIIVPGCSREQRRIVRFGPTLPGMIPMIATGFRYPFEKLLSAADVLLITPDGDTSTTSIAWAMASGVTIIGAAGYAVAEMISHNVNGLLFKKSQGNRCAPDILELLSDKAAHAKMAEVARGQAYEVFGLQRYIQQYTRLYRNVLEAAPPGEGIEDTAYQQG